MFFLKADSLFEGPVLKVRLNQEVCKVVTAGAARFGCRHWLVQVQGQRWATVTDAAGLPVLAPCNRHHGGSWPIGQRTPGRAHFSAC